MPTPEPTGRHWAVVQTEATPGSWPTWIARWALYPTKAAALAASGPDPNTATVSGTTAPFDSEDRARQQGQLDAERTEAVLSGTYREGPGGTESVA